MRSLLICSTGPATKFLACIRSGSLQMEAVSVGAQHAVPAVKTGDPAANWPKPAFRSAGAPRALLTFSSAPQIIGSARPMPASARGEETFYVVKSYNDIETRANTAIVCRAGG